MATVSDFDNYATGQYASRTCIPCKSSKKKCDKTLPTCNRCSRLHLSCTYDDFAETGAIDYTSTFQAVFDRLERLESRVFAPAQERPTVAPDQYAYPNIEISEEKKKDWQLNPSLLQPSYLDLIVAMNLAKILEERRTSVRATGEKYLKLIHDYLPIISKERLEWRIQETESLERNGSFLILISSILLLMEEPVDSFLSSSSAPPPDLYRVCKYNYSLFASLREPCIELVQSGVLLALYEHAQCMGDQAYLTIGTCARIASAIGLYSATSGFPPSSETAKGLEEKANIILGIFVLDRRIKIASKVITKSMVYDYFPITKPSVVAVNNIGPLKYEADGCDILDRLHSALFVSNPADVSNVSTETQVNRVVALDAEIQSLMVKLSDHRGDSLWHRSIATAFTANLCVHTYLRLQTTANIAIECFEQRGKISLELLGFLMDKSSSKLDLNKSTAVFLSPFPIAVLFLLLSTMISLDSAGEDMNLLRERQTFIYMLQQFGRRWRLARRLSEALEQA